MIGDCQSQSRNQKDCPSLVFSLLYVALHLHLGHVASWVLHHHHSCPIFPWTFPWTSLASCDRHPSVFDHFDHPLFVDHPDDDRRRAAGRRLDAGRRPASGRRGEGRGPRGRRGPGPGPGGRRAGRPADHRDGPGDDRPGPDPHPGHGGHGEGSRHGDLFDRPVAPGNFWKLRSGCRRIFDILFVLGRVKAKGSKLQRLHLAARTKVVSL